MGTYEACEVFDEKLAIFSVQLLHYGSYFAQQDGIQSGELLVKDTQEILVRRKTGVDILLTTSRREIEK